MVDIVPDVGFWRSWCLWKACATFSLKVLDLHEDALGFERYDPDEQRLSECFSILGGPFSDQDSGLTGEALDDPRVARCS
jgi:hypothetical protein